MRVTNWQEFRPVMPRGQVHYPAAAGQAVDGVRLPDGMRGARDVDSAGLGNAVRGAGQTAGMIGGAAMGGIMGMVQAADPFSTMPTFNESLKGLSIEVGGSFLPVIDQMSAKIQQATRWFEGLDKSTKQSVASTLAWSAVGLTGAAAAARLGSMAVSATIAVRGLALAMMPLVMTPMGLLVTGVTAAAGAYLLLGRNAREAAGHMREAGRAAPPRGGPATGDTPARGAEALTQAELDRLPDRGESLREAKSDPLKLAEAMAAYRRKIDEDLKRVQGAQPEHLDVARKFDAGLKESYERTVAERDEAIELRRKRPTGDTSGLALTDFQRRIFKEPEAATDLTQKELVRRREALTKSALPEGVRFDMFAGYPGGEQEFYKDMLAGKVKAFPKVTQERLQGARDREITEIKSRQELVERVQQKTGIGTPEETLTRAYGSLPAPRITDSQSYADTIQIAALKGDDLQARNLEKQLQNLEDIKGLLKSVSFGISEIEKKTGPNWR